MNPTTISAFLDELEKIGAKWGINPDIFEHAASRVSKGAVSGTPRKGGGLVAQLRGRRPPPVPPGAGPLSMPSMAGAPGTLKVPLHPGHRIGENVFIGR
jgi:hypothetical protein